MDDERTQYESGAAYFHRGLWRVQPRWAKAVYYFVGLPAFAIFTGTILFGQIGSTIQIAAFTVFGLVCLIQMTVVFRAFWRMDL
jgi:hypothetical protein